MFKVLFLNGENVLEVAVLETDSYRYPQLPDDVSFASTEPNNVCVDSMIALEQTSVKNSFLCLSGTS